MSAFVTPLQASKISRDRWKLQADLVYTSDILHESITVPAGFVTDLASVPRLPLAYLLTGGKADSAAVVHDWLYSTQHHDRRVADAVFYEAILAEGHGGFTAWLMWAGVRLGGWVGWDAPNLPQPPGVRKEMFGAD